MPFQRDQFGHKSYEYVPTWETEIERNPDRRPSSSKSEIVVNGRELLWILEVRGCGAITLRADSDSKSGRLKFNGVGIFTDEEIQFS